ncbi:hypothetical protein RWE15_13045 [Virgibacillus halophilus]|uniref:LPXTG-motif cell wall anchor domain-containing protein n=1 Tax=Tigheibacillus halophilus TaxID=361280 RepID=A0ABU5C7I0_9BACI|nr:hypothetical protein [Virgibacillus halophilus]
MPKWLEKLSPYGYIPQLPVEQSSASTLIGMTIIALVGISVGLFAYRERDLS